VAFAAVTPFAQEYDAPWLYGVAAIGSMGRVADRQHWVSDAVGGAIVGYAIGSWLWHAQRKDSSSQLAVVPGAKSLSVSWSTAY
jgi:membrane-associated phospholipid phosphatase